MDRTEDYFCHLESEEEAENRETKREEDDNSEEGDSTGTMWSLPGVKTKSQM